MGPQLRGWEEGIMQNWGQAMFKEVSESAQGPRPRPQQEEPPQLLFPGAEGRRAWAAAVPQVGGTAARSGWGARLGFSRSWMQGRGSWGRGQPAYLGHPHLT